MVRALLSVLLVAGLASLAGAFAPQRMASPRPRALGRGAAAAARPAAALAPSRARTVALSAEKDGPTPKEESKEVKGDLEVDFEFDGLTAGLVGFGLIAFNFFILGGDWM